MDWLSPEAPQPVERAPGLTQAMLAWMEIHAGGRLGARQIARAWVWADLHLNRGAIIGVGSRAVQISCRDARRAAQGLVPDRRRDRPPHRPRGRDGRAAGGHSRRSLDGAAWRQAAGRRQPRVRQEPVAAEGLRVRGGVSDAPVRGRPAAAADARAARDGAARHGQRARAPARHGGADACGPFEVPSERQRRADRLPPDVLGGAGHDGAGAAGVLADRRRNSKPSRHDRASAPPVSISPARRAARSLEARCRTAASLRPSRSASSRRRRPPCS